MLLWRVALNFLPTKAFLSRFALDLDTTCPYVVSIQNQQFICYGSAPCLEPCGSTVVGGLRQILSCLTPILSCLTPPNILLKLLLPPSEIGIEQIPGR